MLYSFIFNSRSNIFRGLFDTVYGNFLKFFYLGPYDGHMVFQDLVELSMKIKNKYCKI